MKSLGFTLALVGGTVLAAGLLLLLAERLHLGRLPGDIRVAGRHGTFVFPLTTCILVSLVLTLLLNLAWRLFRR